jgi:hypothetical protein
MTHKRTLVAMAALLALSAFASAQKPVRFTSLYSRLDGNGCKTLRGGQGTDDALLCKGVAGYSVEVYYSAAAMHIAASRKQDPQSSGIATLNLDFDYSKSRLEWRLADGKPFAVIMRVPRYGDPKEFEYFGKVIGQQLFVAGLGGYDIFEQIDAKLPDANAKAREAADKAFLAKK